MSKQNNKTIDELVEEWHTSEDGEATTLHEFLGWSWEEYSEWVMTGRASNA